MLQTLIRNTVNRFKSNIKDLSWQLKLRFTKKIYVSFGENCLTDNILQRYKLKLITTPFSHARSNIEYIIQMESDHYNNFLNKEYLLYESLENKLVPRLKTYNIIQNDYNELHKNGFEFTHHDVIASEAIRLKFMERVKQLQRLKQKKQFFILYHHRINQNTNKERLIDDLLKLKALYTNRKYTSEVICFTQTIITDYKNRKVDYTIKNGIHYFEFYTLDEWAGDNPQLLWARNDEDLIIEMITKIKNIN